jgi:hypothetical protein
VESLTRDLWASPNPLRGFFVANINHRPCRSKQEIHHQIFFLLFYFYLYISNFFSFEIFSVIKIFIFEKTYYIFLKCSNLEKYLDFDMSRFQKLFRLEKCSD